MQRTTLALVGPDRLLDLQLAEAVLVDLGVAMGPVIASIHEKRDELRQEIKAAADMLVEPRVRKAKRTPRKV